MAQKNFMIKNGLRVGDSDLFVTSGGTTVKNLTVGNVSIPSTIGSDNQILKVVSGSLAFASVAEMEDSDLTKVANLQNKVDGLINRLDSDDADRQIGTLVVDSDGQILLNTNDDVANSGTLTIDSDGQILFLTGNDTLDSVGSAILSLRADRDSDSIKISKISEITNRLDSDSAAIQSLATKTRADLDSDSIIIQSLKAATNTNTANIAGLGGIDSDHTFQTLTVNNTTTDDSILVTTTEDSNNAGPVITLKRNSSSVADADYLGQIKFKGENDANQEIVYAKITGKIQDASDGTEDGIIEIAHKKAGSNNISARFNSDTLQLINGTGLEVDGTSTLTSFTSTGIDDNASSTAMTLDSNNNLLVGGTGTVVYGDTTGNQLEYGSYFAIKRETANATQAVVYFNNTGADGNIIDFRKDGTAVGSIGNAGARLFINSGTVGLNFAGDGSDQILPSNAGANRDAAIDLGTTNVRFKDIYLSGGAFLGGTGTANKLDDYEEGTWTPTVTGSSSGSYALDAGFKCTYIKVGNICHISATFGLGTLSGTASGYAQIGGFPFNYNGSVSQSTGAVIFSQANLASTHQQTHIMQASSGTANTFFLPFMRDNDSNGDTDLSIFSASTQITFSFSYQTV